ncbi:MAG: trypsin-like peptidase domain-containing protein [Oscillospiraceae bacterium]|nr:trypsin-like peptidase domain-containing protein [Oscillospiraceae bacterium]
MENNLNNGEFEKVSDNVDNVETAEQTAEENKSETAVQEQDGNNASVPEDKETVQYAVPPAAKKRLSTGWVIGITALITVMFFIIVVLSFAVVDKIKDYNEGKDLLENEIGFGGFKTEQHAEIPGISNNNKIVINLPVSDKPQVSSDGYADKETGLYNTVGLAEAVLPSQVLIGVYNDTPFKMTGAGSGVILTSDGYILTNAHVIDNAIQLKVQLHDGEQYEAEIVGIDRTSDVAVIKINASGLIAAQLGNSDSAVLGEEVAVIGAAGTLENSITFGHISALEREIETDYSDSGKLNCIQTDAALNPGNSGGALVNMYGQVIGLSVGGMNHEYYEGIGFAIEINDVIPVAEELMKNGFIEGRARVGVTYIPITTELAAEYDVPVGICVMEVDPTCDVAAKGIQVYDIITHMDGIAVYDAETIAKAMEDKYAGQAVTMTIYRKTITEEETTFDVEIILAQKYDTVTQG